MKRKLIAIVVFCAISSCAFGADVLWRNTATGDAIIWYLDKDQNITGTDQINPTLSMSYQIAAVGDFSGNERKEYFQIVSLFLGGTTALAFSMAAGKLF